MDEAKALKDRINVAQDLHSVVKTMKALAAVNIRQMEESVSSLSEFNRTIELGLQIVLRHNPQVHAITRRAAVGPLGVVVFGSDQGMCGAMNDQVANFVSNTLNSNNEDASSLTVWAMGARVAARLEDAGFHVAETYSMPSTTTLISPSVQKLLAHINSWHHEGRLNRLMLFYSEHLSVSNFQPCFSTLLPLDREWLYEHQKRKWPTRMLPNFTMNPDRLFSSLIEHYLLVGLFRAYAETLASENASRLAAMQTAERNISDRLRELHAQFHHQRQMTITEELLDIVSGFEALSGPDSVI